jgi:hypothetical protein
MLGPLLEVLSVAMVGAGGVEGKLGGCGGEEGGREKRGPGGSQLAQWVGQGTVRVSVCVYV